MKKAVNLILVFAVYCLIDSMESNYMSIKTGLIWCLIIGAVGVLINKKKTATRVKRNGQQLSNELKYEVHSHYTTRKGGMSR
jgi:hypothetical protein